MHRYLAWRILLFAPTLIIVSFVIFGIMRVLPGDVVNVVLGGTGQTTYDAAQLESLREELGLKDPLAVQYGKWLWSMVNGEFGGRSLVDRESIRSLIARQLPVTVQLALYTMALSIILSVPLGVVAALRQDRWPDYLVRLVTITGQAVPGFWLALLFLLGLLVIFRWSPPVIYSNVWEDPWNHAQIMVWPTLALAWGYGSYLTRVVRASMLEVLRQDYIRTAHGKGLGGWVVFYRHGLRNAMIPIVSVVGLQVGGLLGGAVVLESIFVLPGLGRGIVQAVVARDYPVIQSLATILVVMMLSVNLIVDAVYALLDPRISYDV